MREKAKINLRVARDLAESGLFDPAATRMYYALYQAFVFRLADRGLRPQALKSGATWWEHDMVQNNSKAARGRSSDRLLFEKARILRVQADYKPRFVDPGETRDCLHDVEFLIEELLR